MDDNASATPAKTTVRCLQGCQCNAGKDASATLAKLPAQDQPDMKAKLPGNGAGYGNKNHRQQQ
jgi:hypothetical protein